MSFLDHIFSPRLLALIRKELQQIMRDRRLLIVLVIPPTLQVLLFGFALSAQVSNLRLGVLDDSRTAESRELTAIMTQGRAFVLVNSYSSVDQLGAALMANRIDLGLVIPWDYAKRLYRRQPAVVQLLLNGVDVNTAQIAAGYAEATIAWLNQQRLTGKATVEAQARMYGQPPAGGSVYPRGQANLLVALLYNPGLETAWFVVTGVYGVLLILAGALVASGTMVRERESGTLEQLLMTPASALEIIAAKMCPLFFLVMASFCIMLFTGHLAFHLPIRGNLLLAAAGAALCGTCGIGIGTLIATFARTAAQTQLLTFFVQPPLAVLSGALTPIEAMPKWLQPVTLINPIRHFDILVRDVLLKGAGIETVWPELLALVLTASLLIGFSAWRFRRQLA
ncbi:MAG: ABC transporter permease [Bryobacteraceae bacterium]